MEKKDTKNLVGLDLGTSSVGWAVTDGNYNLVRKNGKDLWGVREFEEADTSAQRRSYRTGRRRKQRDTARIGYLRTCFADAIEAVDPYFFVRLDNSKYYLEDKDINVRTPNGIFDDEGYQDADYYKEYPTVYHLRKELIENVHPPYDPRLVYLAVANLFKRRGHFLEASLSEDSDFISVEKAFYDFADAANMVIGEVFLTDKAGEVKRILADKSLSRTKRSEALAETFHTDKKQKRKMECLKAVCGMKFDVKKLFPDIDTEEKLSFVFSAFDEDSETQLLEILDDEYVLISSMKALYDAASLAGILDDHKYLSSARVDAYDKHKSDLSVLKEYVKEFGSQSDYDSLFRSKEPGSYSAYANSFVNAGKTQRRGMKARKQSDFYAYIKEMIKNYPDTDQKQYILSEMETESFLPKQLTSANGVIPNQVHLKELKKILNNASDYLPFLNEIDESGLTTAERIISLFSFHIPYYCGPISENSEKNGGNGWIVRKESGDVYPWNFESKIDIDSTCEKFISKLIRNCTYICGEKVLPKASLLYEKYQVLNEINCITIDGERISVELKQDIFNDLYKTGKKINYDKLVEYLVSRGLIREKYQLSGIDTETSSSLSSYKKIKKVLGDIIDTDKGQSVAEDVIYLSSIYGGAKKLFKAKLESDHPELTKQQIEALSNLSFNEWGKLSREFLELEGVDKKTGEIRPLISALWETNCNLMELLSESRFTYKEEYTKRRGRLLSSLSEYSPELLDDFYFSAPVKKMINQTMRVVEELIDEMGTAPDRIFIETTRRDEQKGDSGRKESRKNQLLALYKNIKDESRDWADLIDWADRSGKLRSKKMYLYITQMGRDMYTGKPIELEDLFKDNLYDIDHIYPRHYIKDDSIHNNLVLVSKPENAHKSDEYPISSSIRSNTSITAYWKYLLDKKLMTEEKYRRLTSDKPFTDEQKAAFISRQIVETGQAVKAAASFLKQALPDTKVILSKAANVSSFRAEFELPKSRIANEFHHANDAYLNIVVGNVFYTKFNQDPVNYIKNEYLKDKDNGEYNLGKMFRRNVCRNGETVWIASKGDETESGTILTVRKTLLKNTPIISRQIVIRHGGIADQTIYGKDVAKKESYIPIKTKKDEKLQDVTKYGGFTNVSIAYFCLVEHTVGEKRIRTLEAVPVYLVNAIKKDPTKLGDFLVNKIGLQDISIRREMIPLNSKVRLNGFDVYLSGKSLNVITLKNAVNLCLKPKWIKQIKDIEKYLETDCIPKGISEASNMELYSELMKKHVAGIYSKKPNPIGEKLLSGEKAFKKLPLKEQCYVLFQILKLSAVGIDPKADLRKIGASKNSGKMGINKNISKLDQCILIESSITGLKEHKVDLLSV